MTTAIDSPDLKFKAGDEVEFFHPGNSGTFTGKVVDYMWAGYWTVDSGGEPLLLHEEENEMKLVKDEVPVPEFGMSSAGLAEAVAEAVTRATARVLGSGQEQYDQGDHQRFEGMPLEELLEMTLEELDDVIVYAVMLEIRFKRILEAINKVVD